MDARVAALIRLLLRDPGGLPGALDAWVAPLSAPADTPRTVVVPA
jgi:hypothetical protein